MPAQHHKKVSEGLPRLVRKVFSNGIGFTLLELVIVIGIIVVMFGAMITMMSPFSYNQQLGVSATSLMEDLRQAQQFSRVQQGGYKYYGVRFYANLGEVTDRQGWKIVRYEPPVGVDPFDFVLPVTFDNVTVIKSSQAADNPVFLENTFFSKGVIIDPSSEFQINPTPPALASIVFTPEGSATSNGQNLLNATNDEITLNLYGKTKTIVITPLTGHIKILN